MSALKGIIAILFVTAIFVFSGCASMQALKNVENSDQFPKLAAKLQLDNQSIEDKLGNPKFFNLGKMSYISFMNSRKQNMRVYGFIVNNNGKITTGYSPGYFGYDWLDYCSNENILPGENEAILEGFRSIQGFNKTWDYLFVEQKRNEILSTENIPIIFKDIVTQCNISKNSTESKYGTLISALEFGILDAKHSVNAIYALPGLASFATLYFLGMPYATCKANLTIYYKIYDNNGIVIDYLTESGKGSAASAFYYGYSSNGYFRMAMGDDPGDFKYAAYIKALKDAMRKINVTLNQKYAYPENK